jgi:hemerythrin superfamily protein
MKATELLLKQHRTVDELFEKLEESEESDDKREIFRELAHTLVAHDAIEREIFYPACEQELGSEDDVLGESLVEHGVVEFCLFRADQRQSAEDFDKYITVLKEAVEHHVEEEEESLLPKVKRAMDAEALEELGEKMEKRFEAAMKADFRAPLRDNLDQVLAGSTKTQKKSASTSKSHGQMNSRSKSSKAEPRVAKRRVKTRGSRRRG